MSDESAKEIQPAPQVGAAEYFSHVPMDQRGVQLGNLDEAYRFAQAVCRSGLAPKGDKPESVMVKMQVGKEHNLVSPPLLSGFVSTRG